MRSAASLPTTCTTAWWPTSTSTTWTIAWCTTAPTRSPATASRWPMPWWPGLAAWRSGPRRPCWRPRRRSASEGRRSARCAWAWTCRWPRATRPTAWPTCVSAWTSWAVAICAGWYCRWHCCCWPACWRPGTCSAPWSVRSGRWPTRPGASKAATTRSSTCTASAPTRSGTWSAPSAGWARAWRATTAKCGGWPIPTRSPG